ncbi:MAG: DNA repair protein RecN, partial [Firmicutes bacterium]|nr:DNA repair protein RecN [Bacillota bacterium]
MIEHISIKNFAIIKELSLDLKPGLNIITGETGAGKSIIIEAISMALGARADTDYIRTGEDKAVISMALDPEDAAVSGILEDAGVEDEGMLILQRDISSQGRSLCRINGSMVPLSVLNRLCRNLADIHGQYDNQNLLDPENHTDILDLYGGPALSELKGLVSGAYKEYVSASGELMKLRKSIAETRRQKELLSFELGEIRAAGLAIGEDQELEERVRLMQNSESIYSALSQAYEAIYGGDNDMDAMSPLGHAMDQLGSVEDFSADIKAISEAVSDAYYKLDDLNSSIRKLRDSINFEPEELNMAIERLETVNSMKKRYGGSIEAVLAYAEEAEEKLKTAENAEERVSQLEKMISESFSRYSGYAGKLTQERQKTALLLCRAVNKELAELNFRNADFKVSIESSSPSEKGSDKIEFLITTNKGEAHKPLAKIASGGELSRIMLALKSILGELDRIPTMIFDEIDSGISGATAGIVGNKLKAISKDHQIICITHLPQIAALGDHPYRIEKTSDEISTSTTVVPLDEAERVEELARLLSGTEITDTARLQAREM